MRAPWALLQLLLSGRGLGRRDSGDAEAGCGPNGVLCDETSGYITVMDAGSTGTRAHLFHYGRRKLEPRRFPLIVDAPLTLPQRLATFSTSPGISAFLNDSGAVGRSLGPLLRSCADALFLHSPEADIKHVPLYLGATAGMRVLKQDDRDKVMKAVRAFFRSSSNPFAFARDEQARVLAGEEEGAFGWLALNEIAAHISPNPWSTYGAVDFGGGSVQIAFVPPETSILAGIFAMHVGGAAGGPIHLYSHSFLRFGFVDAFQRLTARLHSNRTGNFSQVVVDHPCLPKGLTWQVEPGEYGVSTTDGAPRRHGGPLELRGTGDFEACRAAAMGLVVEAPCFQQPCSFMGVYQPRVDKTPFVLFGVFNELESWEVSILVRKGVPLLQALEQQLPRVCALPLSTQVELFGKKGLYEGGEPQCWRGTWMLTMLHAGFGFDKDSRNLHHYQSCCDHALGHAIYEVNFFPYRVKRASYAAFLSADGAAEQEAAAAGWLPTRGKAAAAVALAAAAAAAALMALFRGGAMMRARRLDSAGGRSGLRPLLVE